MARRVRRASLDAWLRDVERLLETDRKAQPLGPVAVEERQGDAA